MSLGYQALRRGAAWLDLSARGRIVARGRDRARLLHAIASNEVKKMTPGTGCYAFLLNPQGRIQADLCLFCHQDHFLIDTEPELREKVRARRQFWRRWVLPVPWKTTRTQLGGTSRWPRSPRLGNRECASSVRRTRHPLCWIAWRRRARWRRP